MLELILALLLGIISGIFTGLIPGIHINLLAVILISSLNYFTNTPLIALIIFIVSLAITHTFIDFIPSVFLGAPEEDTFLSILPGHEMLKKGLAHEAVVLTLYGSITAILIILIFTPVFIYIVPLVFNASRTILPFLLIFASLYLVLREENELLAITVFILAGFLGFASLNLPVKQPLLPLLTGLFGASSLIISLKNKTTINKQKITPLKKIKPSKKEYFNAAFGSIISAPLCSFLPGVGAGHAAVIGSELIKQSRKGFLILIGSINTVVLGLSFITLYTIDRTRTGAAVAVREILRELSLSDLTIILAAIFISGIISFFIAIKISKLIAGKINNINYQKLSLMVLIFITLVVIFFSNFLGIIVFITSSLLGVFTILSGARRINLMGCLLIPTILFYLFL